MEIATIGTSPHALFIQTDSGRFHRRWTGNIAQNMYSWYGRCSTSAWTASNNTYRIAADVERGQLWPIQTRRRPRVRPNSDGSKNIEPRCLIPAIRDPLHPMKHQKCSRMSSRNCSASRIWLMLMSERCSSKSESGLDRWLECSPES